MTSSRRWGQIFGITSFSGICSCADVPKKNVTFCTDAGTVLQRQQIPINCKTLLLGKYLRKVLFWQFTKALFPEVQVSCKDTAPCVYVSQWIPIRAYDHLPKCFLKVTSLGVPIVAVLGSIEEQDVTSQPPISMKILVTAPCFYVNSQQMHMITFRSAS